MKQFWANESGSAAIDWVALAGGVLLLGLMVVYAVFNVGVADVSSAVADAMRSADCDNGTPLDTPGEGSKAASNVICPPGDAPQFND